MKEKRAVIKAWSARYRKAGKKDKGLILDELVALTGYNRWYAVWLLSGEGKVIRVRQRLRLKGDLRQRASRKRPRIYDEAVAASLKMIWRILDFICGKRLVAILPEVIPILERYGEIALEGKTREKLLTISAATVDRLLAPARQKLMLRGRSGTKPGTLLKHQIPIRTFAEWDEQRVGFVEIDLVGHEGGDAHGDFCQTLDVTDIASGWTETQAVLNKSQVRVFEALKSIRERLPFPLLGIDSDNGAEFINAQLLRYCRDERITFTRGRSGNKNDGCFVEQKNYSVVRRAVGYVRYDSPAQLRLLNRLYGRLRLYTNYFQPVMKLVSKERHGAKVKKRHDEPKTPYQRLMAMPDLAPEDRTSLKAEYLTLNPAELKRQIDQLQDKLMRSAARRRRAARSSTIRHQSAQEIRAI